MTPASSAAALVSSGLIFHRVRMRRARRITAAARTSSGLSSIKTAASGEAAAGLLWRQQQRLGPLPSANYREESSIPFREILKSFQALRAAFWIDRAHQPRGLER